jgi:hypothetical protein
VVDDLPSGFVFNELIPYWELYPPSHRVACLIAGIDNAPVSKPNQNQIDAEFARLASSRVHPSAISGVMTLPSNVLAVMEKYKDYPI